MWQLNNLRLGKSLSSSGFGVTAGNPSLNLNFLGTSTLNPLVTFTRASSGTYFDSTGTLQTAGNNAARFDYNPSTLASRGLLIEEQRTNLLTYSEQFNETNWQKGNSSITANATTALDGATTADKLVENNANSTHQVFQTFTTTNAVTYAFSVFAKASERTEIAVRLGSGAGAFSAAAEVIVNLNNGAVVSGSGQVFNSGNGWYRISVTNTAISAAAADGIIRLASSGSTTYTGDSTSGAFIWGAQLEAGAFATSYIPTTTASATRSADVASVNTLSPWYNASAGTLLAQYSTFQTGAGNGLVAFSDASINNRIQLGHSSGSRRFVVTTLAATQCNLVGGNLGSVSANVVAKIAAAYKLNDFAASVNAGTVDTDTIGFIPSVNIFYLGSGFSGGDTLNGHIQRITYYPRRLPNAALQSLTA